MCFFRGKFSVIQWSNFLGIFIERDSYNEMCGCYSMALQHIYVYMFALWIIQHVALHRFLRKKSQSSSYSPLFEGISKKYKNQPLTYFAKKIPILFNMGMPTICHSSMASGWLQNLCKSGLTSPAPQLKVTLCPNLSLVGVWANPFDKICAVVKLDHIPKFFSRGI